MEKLNSLITEAADKHIRRTYGYGLDATRQADAIEDFEGGANFVIEQLPQIVQEFFDKINKTEQIYANWHGIVKTTDSIENLFKKYLEERNGK